MLHSQAMQEPGSGQFFVRTDENYDFSRKEWTGGGTSAECRGFVAAGHLLDAAFGG
jgi:hypothetical protein